MTIYLVVNWKWSTMMWSLPNLNHATNQPWSILSSQQSKCARKLTSSTHFPVLKREHMMHQILCLGLVFFLDDKDICLGPPSLPFLGKITPFFDQIVFCSHVYCSSYTCTVTSTWLDSSTGVGGTTAESMKMYALSQNILSHTKTTERYKMYFWDHRKTYMSF